MADGPLGRARQALLDARAAVEHSPSGANLGALEQARVHMDFLLDTLPIPATPHPSPEAPGASHPGASVYNGEAEAVLPLFLVGGEHWPDDDGVGQ